MDASDIFNRGSSIPRIVNLTYEDTGLPIDTDDLDEIIFTIIHAATTRVLGVYSLGGGEVTVLDSVNGQVQFIVPQSTSALAKLGKYFMNAETHETDGDYENNNHIREMLTFCFKLML